MESNTPDDGGAEVRLNLLFTEMCVLLLDRRSASLREWDAAERTRNTLLPFYRNYVTQSPVLLAEIDRSGRTGDFDRVDTMLRNLLDAQERMRSLAREISAQTSFYHSHFMHAACRAHATDTPREGHWLIDLDAADAMQCDVLHCKAQLLSLWKVSQGGAPASGDIACRLCGCACDLYRYVELLLLDRHAGEVSCTCQMESAYCGACSGCLAIWASVQLAARRTDRGSLSLDCRVDCPNCRLPLCIFSLYEGATRGDVGDAVIPFAEPAIESAAVAPFDAYAEGTDLATAGTEGRLQYALGRNYLATVQMSQQIEAALQRLIETRDATLRRGGAAKRSTKNPSASSKNRRQYVCSVCGATGHYGSTCPQKQYPMPGTVIVSVDALRIFVAQETGREVAPAPTTVPVEEEEDEDVVVWENAMELHAQHPF